MNDFRFPLRQLRKSPGFTFVAIISVYGVISYLVTERIREIGIRLALGARRRSMRLILKQGIQLAVAGAAIGIGCALIGCRLMESLLFEVEANDPLSFPVSLRFSPLLRFGLLFSCASRDQNRSNGRSAARVNRSMKIVCRFRQLSFLLREALAFRLRLNIRGTSLSHI
jgi:FtsX-like permease family protein